MKALADDPQHASPGQGQMKPEQLEIAQLKREVVQAEGRTRHPKKSRGLLRENRREVRINCEAPGDLAGGMVVRGARCLAGCFYPWLTRPRSRRSRSDEELGAKVAQFLASDRPQAPGGSGATYLLRMWRVACIGSSD